MPPKKQKKTRRPEDEDDKKVIEESKGETKKTRTRSKSKASEKTDKKTSGIVITYGSEHGAIPMTKGSYKAIEKHFIAHGEEGGSVGDCSINLDFFDQYIKFKEDISGEPEATEFVKEVEEYLQYEILDVLALLGSAREYNRRHPDE
mmetsp:Transcript_38377/g.44700  ORF Transcript_38377/g.44700 Transcript_38377/m.44700 type:complete len:147 (+) Transcript_38377:28-468(+)|eukprot:CAMPEP_0176427562 /NCGR_PEP_ID=MMETSP0127-20121128/12640_1 /TAXON_ID=938130 /ORGANISM="Platyophrya macrostoma, Strain WH" /LENGTH=146 /DNA_ID=CAMNT_0017809101 /DNA_START=28 /DNA_END=468 /DNA_ORIENTATION=-